MTRIVTIVLIAGFFGPFSFSSPVSAGSDDFQNLEFFLERSLKNAKDSTEPNEIVNRFLFKALALIHQQNAE